eukprot:scaffold7673_cov258-Pinguiococcus_pyrenoidosus.AAC.6
MIPWTTSSSTRPSPPAHSSASPSSWPSPSWAASSSSSMISARAWRAAHGTDLCSVGYELPSLALGLMSGDPDVSRFLRRAVLFAVFLGGDQERQRGDRRGLERVELSHANWMNARR